MDQAFKGVGVRLKREHEDRAWLAHTMAALQRCEVMPPLSDLTGEPGSPLQQTPDEVERNLMMWLGSPPQKGASK